MAQKPHTPTETTRKEAETLSGFGVPQDDIALLLGISKPTLLKHYPDDLARGMAKANAKMGQCLFQLAMKGNVAAAIFWAKARMGWSEKNVLDVNITADPAALTDAQLAAIIRGGGARVASEETGPEELGGVVH